MSYEEKYAVSKRGSPAGDFTAEEIIDCLRMKELSGIHKVKVGDEDMTVAAFIEKHNAGGLPEQNMSKTGPELKVKEEKPEEEEEEEEEAPPAPSNTPPPEPGPTDEIHVSRDNQRFGPYLINEVHDYLKSGNLRFSDLVWYTGVNDWMPLSSVPGVGEGVDTLHAAAPPPPKPPPPPPAPAAPPQPPSTLVGAGGPPPATETASVPERVFGGQEGEDDKDAMLEKEREGIASPGPRALALLIDTLLITFATSAVVGLVYGLHNLTNPGNIAGWLYWTVPLVVAVIVGWLYSSLTESSNAMATVGKRVINAQVCVEETGERMRFGRASARAFAKIAGVLGFFFIFMSIRRQTLHDMMVGTIVRQREDTFNQGSEEEFEEDDEFEAEE